MTIPACTPPLCSCSRKFRRFIYKQLLKIKNLPPPNTDFPANLYPKIRLYFTMGNLARDFDYSLTIQYHLVAIETLEETGLYHSQEFMRFQDENPLLQGSVDTFKILVRHRYRVELLTPAEQQDLYDLLDSLLGIRMEKAQSVSYGPRIGYMMAKLATALSMSSEDIANALYYALTSYEYPDLNIYIDCWASSILNKDKKWISNPILIYEA